MLLVCTVYSVQYSEIALSRKPFGIRHMYVYTILLRMTDTMTSLDTDLPPSTSRILSYLLVCDRHELSAQFLCIFMEIIHKTLVPRCIQSCFLCDRYTLNTD
jgi:hypothetical protein